MIITHAYEYLDTLSKHPPLCSTRARLAAPGTLLIQKEVSQPDNVHVCTWALSLVCPYFASSLCLLMEFITQMRSIGGGRPRAIQSSASDLGAGEWALSTRNGGDSSRLFFS